jgi:amino-acid N-acetyltransferase
MSDHSTSTPCVELRSGRADDLPAVLSLLQRNGLPTEGVTADALPDFVIAEENRRVLGVAGLEVYRESALLRSAAVEQSWRGSGVGRALIDRTLDLARERGIHDVFLLTTTAEHYFPRFGFACVSRESIPAVVQVSAEFQGACPASAVAMHKVVNSKAS